MALLVENIFFDIGLMIIVATVLGLLASVLRQPKIPAYILAGIILGPLLHIITDIGIIELLAEIGIAFLLFGVGLELDLKKVRHMGLLATVGSGLHILVLFTLGVILALGMGYSSITATYVGLILAFSSTLVAIKLLSDKHELDSLHGRIVIGILLVQDVAAIVALSLLNTIGTFTLGPVVISLSMAGLVLVIAYLCQKWLFPILFKYVARSQDLLFLLSIAVCFLFSLIFFKMGFSIAIGGFVAGITLGNLPYNVEISARVRPLREFFSILFFVAIGAHLAILAFSTLTMPLILLTLFCTIVVPIVTIIIITFFGYPKKTAFLAGLCLLQISEFSLIIALHGKRLGHIPDSVFGLVIWLAIITMTISAYFLTYDEWLYKRLHRVISYFDIKSEKKSHSFNIEKGTKYRAILVGYDRMGRKLFKSLAKMNIPTIIIDINPDIIKDLSKMNIPCMYGDIGDPEIHDKVALGEKEIIISTAPSFHDNLLIVKKIKREHTGTTVIVTALLPDEALELYDAGADFVLIPHHLGGEHASLILQEVAGNVDKLIEKKLEHVRELKDHLDERGMHRT